MSVKRWKTHLVIAALLIGFVGLAMPPRQRSAAAGDCSPTIVVTGAADSGAGTLRQALLDICPQGLITFDFPAPTTILLTSAPLVVNVSVTIDAAGAPGVTLSGGNSRRVLGVSSGVVVGLRGLTIRDGLAGYGGEFLMPAFSPWKPSPSPKTTPATTAPPTPAAAASTTRAAGSCCTTATSAAT